MTFPPVELDSDPLDPWTLIERVRANPSVLPETLATIEQLHSTFEKLGSDYANADDKLGMDALRLALCYGLVLGAHEALSDKKILEFADDLVSRTRQSKRGKRSGEVRSVSEWHEPATALAIKVRREQPNLSQAKLADEMLDQWKADVAPPSAERLEKFISTLEKKKLLAAREKPRREPVRDRDP